MQRLLLIVFLFSVQNLFAQNNIGGIWKGTLTQGPGGCFPVYNIELQINIEGTKLRGVSYHYSDLTNYVKEDFEGSFDPKSRMATIRETRVQTFHVPPDCVPCIKRYNLQHRRDKKEELLVGEWGGMIYNQNAACPPGRITLKRAVESDFDHIKEIKVDTGKIRMDFYDNAEIDGDTISVLLNNQVVVSYKRLAAKPISVEFNVDLSRPEQEVIMVGENMGSIPPNTALLIVTAGNKRYQLYLTSNGKKNATVRFIYEPPPANTLNEKR